MKKKKNKTEMACKEFNFSNMHFHSFSVVKSQRASYCYFTLYVMGMNGNLKSVSDRLKGSRVVFKELVKLYNSSAENSTVGK